MGGKHSVSNETAHTWHYNTKSGEYKSLASGATAVFKGCNPIRLRYENHKHTDLECCKGGKKYRIIERRDRSQFELLCETEGHEHVCLHFDEQEKRMRQQQRREQERREQQRQEEQRREQERREQQKREEQRREQEHREQQRREQERREQQRREQERREQQRREQERREVQRREQLRLEQERREQQRREEQKREQEHREVQRREQLRLEQEQRKQQIREQQRLEQLRLEQEQREQQRIEPQRREQEQRELHELRELQKQEHKQAYYLVKGEDNTADPLDELLVVEQRFDDMLSEFQITEDKDKGVQKLEDRMRFLQNQLMIQYFGEDHLPFNSLLAIDQAIGYEDLCLTEKLNVLKATVKVTVDSDYDDILPLSQSREHGFLLRLLMYLPKEKSDLAVRVLYSFTESVTALTSESKALLGHILFNDIWTPDEIILFLQKVVESPQNDSKITAILETVLTYRLSCSSVLCALHERDPVKNLSQQVESEVDKDLDTLISEMRETSYPESTLNIICDVLRYVQDELPKLSDDTILSKDEIYNGKRRIHFLDFANPDIADLQQLLILMSRAVRECTTVRGGGYFFSKVKRQGYFPRLTQLASLLLLLLPQERRGEGCLLEIATGEEKRGKGCLLQISTGEGKTCILAMFAAIQAIRGVKPDIVTSSPVLADRDQKQWSPLYSMFDLTSSVVPPEMTNDNFEELVRVAYSKDIVYGTVGTFAADTLRQEFEGETTRSTRRFDMVIVDEVDYMTLDNGVQITFLSHQDCVLRHMEQVLAGIWAMLSACKPIEMRETGEIHWITKPQHFHKTVVSALGVPESEDFSALDILQLGVNFELGLCSQDEIDKVVQAESKVGDDQDFRDAKTSALEEIMTRAGPAEQYKLLRTFEKEVVEGNLVEYFLVVDNKATVHGEFKASHSSKDKVRLLLLEKGLACQIIPENDLISRTVDRLKSKIKYSDECDPKNIKSYSEFIVIPSFLKEYTEHQLQLFAENALRAIGIVEGREYMIEKAPEADTKGDSDSESHQYDAIIPVDFMSSGVLQKNSKWGDGLQQFLEMKHQLAISPLTTVTNYMSNIHYFQMYLSGEGIFGVSGTLGGGAEKDFLSRHYKTNSYVMPTHRRKKMAELPAIKVQGNELWIQKICETACKVTDRGQVVVIICEDVKTANELKEMETLKKYPITMYTISGRDEIEKQTFSRGNIIIATNLAGRGTDIQVEPEVNKCGGLFVLLTHFPKSQRVEKQVFGRTARKGNPGMVQMILSQEQLEPAYQGQSVEVMRQFREQRELNHIQHMEDDELHVIKIKEKLFSTFCGFLDDFCKNYSDMEKKGCDGMKIQEVPEDLKSHRHKFDYHPAVSSLKGSWAFWLTHHEEDIRKVETKKDLEGLNKDLIGELQLRENSLLKGKSKNFHDHIKQAASRTDLHRWNKREGYGLKEYWQSAAVCDPFYSAVALYNKAYVTINLRKGDYKSEAEELLKKAQDLVDVFLNETTNTMMFCNFSVTKDFKSHHGNTNFLMQMQVRMNLFKSWKDYIKRALDKLAELKSGDDATAEESSVYCLLGEKDFITANELRAMYKYGLGIVFEVKKKPRFSINSLICFFIGVLQVVAGTLVCALSGGALISFGLGLINEGVSDMITGVTGMIKGTFDWADWAISKSISIGMSLLCGGLKYLNKVGLKGLKNIGTSVRSGAKSIVKGAKSVTTTTLKQATKQAAKYTGQELAKQGLLAAVNYGIDEAFKAVFQKIFRSAFEKKVSSLIRANSQLGAALTQFICQKIPQEVIKTKTNDFKIDPLCEEDLRGSVSNMTTTVIPELLTDLTQVDKVISILSQVCNSALSALENQKASGILAAVSKVLDAAEYTKSVIEMLESIPTKEMINGQFVPRLLMQMEHLQQKDYKEDGRQELSDVKRLKEVFITEIAKRVSDAFVDAFVEQITSIASRIATRKVNYKIGKCVENVLGRDETKRFFDDQKSGHKLRMASQAPPKPLSKSNESELTHYIQSLSSSEKPATGLELHILAKSNLLKGKGVRIILTDEHGGPLYEEYYPGSQSSSGDITLRLVKEKDTSQQKKGVLPSLSRPFSRGEFTPYSGHFEVVNPDGTISPVHSEGQNCLYQAIAQATSSGPRDVGDLRREASTLRNELKQEVQQNLPKYGSLLRLQQGYEESYSNPGRFTISGGTIKNRKEDKEKYKNALNSSNLSPNDNAYFKAKNLGMVGEYTDVIVDRQIRNGEMNADHIPPKSTYKKAFDIVEKDPDFKRTHPKLYEELKKSQSNNTGSKLLCMEVLNGHHRQALTTGMSMEARVCREEMAKALSKGEVEKTLKMAFITAHPETSQNLKKDAINLNKNPPTGLGADYYQVGYRLLIDKNFDKGLIDSNVKDHLHSWVNEKKYMNQNTNEYRSIKEAISRSNNA